MILPKKGRETIRRNRGTNNSLYIAHNKHIFIGRSSSYGFFNFYLFDIIDSYVIIKLCSLKLVRTYLKTILQMIVMFVLEC